MTWLILLAIVGFAAVVHAVLLTLQTHESARFARNHLRLGALEYEPPGRAVLIVPCKGDETGLAENLSAFLAQDYPDYEVLFVVEEEDDPAVPVIRSCLAANPQVSGRVVVGGLAVDSGQKVHNLLAATRELPADVTLLAFADSDARPHKTWLRAMIWRLYESGGGAATGYRWFVPERPTLANRLLYSINSSIAGVMGPGGHYLVWGGSWVIRRDVFEATGLGEAWPGTLSDDLVASRVLRAARLPINFAPQGMVASPVDTTAGGLAEFLRRQYLISRRYVPLYWAAAIAALTLSQLSFWGGLATALVGLATGQTWWPVFLVAPVCIYTLTAYRAAVRQKMGRQYLPHYTKQLAAAGRFDIWANPLVALVNWLALVSSLAGNAITWRGNRYHILPGGRIQFLGRRPGPGFRGQLAKSRKTIQPGAAKREYRRAS